MKHEEPKAESSIESTISKIKKAEAEKEVEGAVVEAENEAVAKAVKDEMLDYTEGEIESRIEELEINPEEKERKETKERLIEYSKEIYKTGKDYEMVYSHFKPSGGIDEETGERRTYTQEIDFYLEQREGKYKDEYKDIPNSRDLQEKYKKVYGGYNLTIAYPELDKVDIQKLKNDIADLEIIEENVKDKTNESVKNIVLEIISIVKAKINILVEIKNGNPEKAFENAKIAYGDINDQLCKKAKKCYEEKIEFLKEKKEKGIVKSDLEKALEESEFNAEEIKRYFDLALDKGDLRYNNLEVIIDEKATAIDVRPSDPNYDHPVIVIPPSRKVDGMKLVQLIAHEIGCHVVQNNYNYKLGLEGLSFGKDWETAQEGFAVRNEAKIRKEILGESYADFEIKAMPYYILAMEKIREGADIGEVYDYIFDLRKEEFLAEGDSEKESEKKASEKTKITLRRTVRGMYPYYFPKDKAYLEGEFMALEIEKEGVGDYLKKSRVDPALVPDMIKAGVYSGSYAYKKGLEAATNIAERICEERKGDV